MGDERTTETEGPGDISRCEWCGAEYDTTPAPQPLRSAPPGRATSLAPVEGETHCEWCGAEYPVSEGGD